MFTYWTLFWGKMLPKRGRVVKPYGRNEVWTVRLKMKSESREVENRLECGCGDKIRERCVELGYANYLSIQS